MNLVTSTLARPGRRLAGVATAVSLVAVGGVAAAAAPSVAATKSATSAAATTLPKQVVSRTVRTSSSRALPMGAKVRFVAKSWHKNGLATSHATVAAVLRAQGVHWDSNDKIIISPASSADRRAGAVAKITVQKVSVVKQTTRKRVHYRTVVKYSKARYKSLGTLVKRNGHNGTHVFVQRLTKVDGKVVGRQTLATRSSVVNKVVVKGTKKTPRRATVAYSRAVGKDMVRRKGWSSRQYTCLVKLWNRESGWRVTAYNRSSGARGIPQALPGNKMASKGRDWKTNPKTQISWGLSYIKGRYGSPCGALSHSYRTGWY